MKNFKIILLAVVAMFITATAVAQEKPQGLKLPSVVGSDMVLQHSSNVNIWGWAKPKAKVKISYDWVEGKPVTVKADENGKVQFRGFKGKYRITYKDKRGKEQTMEYILK